MSNVKQIKRAVSSLTREELSEVRAWFLEFDAEVWDQQLEEDVAAGRLDDLAGEAVAEYRAGHTRPS